MGTGHVTVMTLPGICASVTVGGYARCGDAGGGCGVPPVGLCALNGIMIAVPEWLRGGVGGYIDIGDGVPVIRARTAEIAGLCPLYVSMTNYIQGCTVGIYLKYCDSGLGRCAEVC